VATRGTGDVGKVPEDTTTTGKSLTGLESSRRRVGGGRAESASGDRRG